MVQMTSRTHTLLFSFSSLFFLLSSGPQWAAAAQSNHTSFHVGVILDIGTGIGNMSWSCISIAMDDFYAAHPDYKTRLVLHLRDSGQTSISAASAALYLLKNIQVQAIIGPQRSSQAKFLLELGEKTQVPIISFSAKSPSLSTTQFRYFVRTAMNDSSQAKAIAAIVQTFRWRQVVPIFEDTEYGNGIIPYLVDAFQEIDTRVPYRSAITLSATKERILEELYKLKTMQTRVFVVHTTYKLGLLFFSCAEEAGMMGEGFVWITTYGLTDIVEFMESSINVMQGVLGVKPYVQDTKLLSEFRVRLRRNFLLDNPHLEATEPSVFGLWGYDTLWALATAVENIGVGNSSFQNADVTNTSVDLKHLGFSSIGPKLLNSLMNINFNGLSGKFHLVEGQLQSTTMEIINVIGKGKRRIGFWTSALGISQHMDSKADLKLIMWPGESTTVPKGWEWPTSDNKLKIGVPVKPGFSQFVSLTLDPLTNKFIGSGFCIEVFDAVMAELPYAVRYDYFPFENSAGESNGTYDELIYQVYLQNFDAVVGDVAIIANRSLYVDFTLPFTESGVSMVVPIKDDRSKRAWIFLKPLTADLWLASGAFFVFTGCVVWILEHRINEEFRGPPAHQLGTTFYFAFSTLVFAHREKLVNNLSRVVVIIWVFVVLILTSSYTASLTSMLTVQQLQPTVTDMNELRKSGDSVGYLNDSFMPGLLKRLNFDPVKLKAYQSPDQYAEAMSKGSLNGGVSAIVDEIPYIKVFLSKYCGEYTMVGPTYKTDGFGFVFPKGSPLVPDVSRAILKITEGEIMTTIEKTLYGNNQECPQQSSSTLTSNSLTFDSFSGLFLITGIASASALILFLVFFLYENQRDLKTLVGSENSFLRSLSLFAKFYDQRDPSSIAFRKTKPSDKQMTGLGTVMASSPHPLQCPSSLSSRTYGNFDTEEEGEEEEEEEAGTPVEEEEAGTPVEEEGTPGREIASQHPDPPSFAEMLNGMR